MKVSKLLNKKYVLHKSQKEKLTVLRDGRLSDENYLQKPKVRINNYILDRFKRINEQKDQKKREMQMRILKKVLHKKFVIKPEEIPKAYFENQCRSVGAQGHVGIEIPEVLQKQLTEAIITDQMRTLDNWVNYLLSNDAIYPDWLKYYAFRSILNMGEFDKGKKQFSKRSKGTVEPFPDLNREALAYVLDAIEKKAKKEKISSVDLSIKGQEQFQKLVQGENFSKLYTWAIEQATSVFQETLANIKGQWIKFDQGLGYMSLAGSLHGQGTGWCVAGESTAQTQLKDSDFYVYYSCDEEGKPTIPRVFIRIQENRIAEVRGRAYGQNLDIYISDVVKKKLNEFPDNIEYRKKVNDMEILAEIEKKTKTGQGLDKNDLIFLYEINSQIESFGYQRNPKIEELRNRRNSREDAPIVFECDPSEIAWKKEDITKKTKTYIGGFFPGIFQKDIEHIYTSFPEGKLQKLQVEIRVKTKDQYKTELKEKNINISAYALDILESKYFIISKNIKNVDLVRLTVKDLGFISEATTDEIYKRARYLGLEICPAEVVPQLRLQYPGGEWIFIAMKQIIVRHGYPYVFSLGRSDNGLWLAASYASPLRKWPSHRRFIFRLCKKEPYQVRK